MKQFIFTLWMGAAMFSIQAQTSVIRVVPFPRSMDSLNRLEFQHALEQFIIWSESGKPENPLILPEERIETEVLTDELKGIRSQEIKGDSLFYDCHLSGLMKENDSSLHLTLTYLKAWNDTPQLKAVISLLALKRANNWLFHSLLKSSTKGWKHLTFDNHKVYYPNQILVSSCKKYFQCIDRYDAILNTKGVSIQFYSCDQFQDALRICGIVYHRDYQGYKQNALQHGMKKIQVSVNGLYNQFNTPFDPHDLWHARLRKAVTQPENINRPVDEGAAYLFGGSWGISWDSIQYRFQKWVKENPNTDWTKAYQSSVNFDPKCLYPLNIDFMINALIISDIMKKEGFLKTMPLLCCGKKEKNNANYFAALNQLTGVEPSGFNDYVNRLIKTSYH